MEFLLVRFEDKRGVIVDDVPQGSTNEVIQLDEGTHFVTLSSPPSDFTPEQAKIALSGTTPISPMEVIFEKIS